MHNASSTAYIILATSETAGDLQDHTSCIIAFDDNDFQLVTVTTPQFIEKKPVEIAGVVLSTGEKHLMISINSARSLKDNTIFNSAT